MRNYLISVLSSHISGFYCQRFHKLNYPVKFLERPSKKSSITFSIFIVKFTLKCIQQLFGIISSRKRNLPVTNRVKKWNIASIPEAPLVTFLSTILCLFFGGSHYSNFCDNRFLAFLYFFISMHP